MNLNYIVYNRDTKLVVAFFTSADHARLFSESLNFSLGYSAVFGEYNWSLLSEVQNERILVNAHEALTVTKRMMGD